MASLDRWLSGVALSALLIAPSAHAGEENRVLDVEEVAQRGAELHGYSFPFDQ